MCSVTCSAAARNYAFAPKPHDDLGGALGYMDFETAAKLSGARFVVLKKASRGWSARSGSSCSISTPTSTATPRSIRRCWCANDVMFGTGQLPKFEDDQFWAIKGETACSRRDDGRH